MADPTSSQKPDKDLPVYGPGTEDAEQARRLPRLATLLVVLAAILIGGGSGVGLFQTLLRDEGSPRAHPAFFEMLTVDPRWQMLATISFFVGGVAIAVAIVALVAVLFRLKKLFAAKQEFQERRVLLAATAEQKREAFREAEYKSSVEGMDNFDNLDELKGLE